MIRPRYCWPAPWLSRPWRRAAWATLLLIGVARLITGGLLPMQLVLALAAGVTVGAGLLVAFGVPDRRMGPAGVAAALRAGGVPVSQVTGPYAAKGSRPFQVTTGDGPALFVKVFGSDQRDADLLYRAYRGIRLHGVGDTRPAASLLRAVEHEALVAVMAERAGVAVPHVGQVIRAGDGSVLLTMELIPGRSLNDIPAGSITDELAREVWREVGRLHQARIAHRSLHGTNIMIGQNGCPWLRFTSLPSSPLTSRRPGSPPPPPPPLPCLAPRPPAADPAGDRRAGRRLLLPASPDRAGEQQLACATERELGVAAGDHRPVRADLRGERGGADRLGARACPVRPGRAGAGRLVVHQPGVALPNGSEAGFITGEQQGRATGIA